MSMSEIFHSDEYTDGRTKQAFKDQTDINKILAKAARGDAITHLAKHGATYGDFTDIDDLLTATRRLEKGKMIFADLPGEVRREFSNDVGAFFNYVNDPKNVENLERLIPGLTKRGNQLPALNQAPPEPPTPPEPPAPPAAPEEPPAS